MTETPLTITIDGPRFATAHKAITATIGTNNQDPDTNQIIWAQIWENEGIQLATFNGKAVSTAYIPQITDDTQPTRHPDYQATIRANNLWHTVAATTSKDSDQLVQLSPLQNEGTHLPGLEPPPGLQLALNGPEGTFVASAKGLETVNDTDWAEYIAQTTQPTQTPPMVASANTFKAVTIIASAIGDLTITPRLKFGADVVILTPRTPADQLGLTFTALMSWTAPTTEETE